MKSHNTYRYRRHGDESHKDELARVAVGVMIIKGLEPNFSPEVQEQLSQISTPAVVREKSIIDLRNLPWCSIDNDDSKDLDQLTVMTKLSGDVRCLLVAIADVDALIKKSSPIDEHAFINTRSVYTSARIFPMLPLKLSTNLTSLNPGQDRLAIVCEMHFIGNGVLKESKIYRALVQNKIQLAYDETSEWLEGNKTLFTLAKNIGSVAGIEEQLRAQDKLAQQLRVRRHDHGSLELNILQPRASFIDDTISEIKQQPQNRARQLIEEFMIATNGCTSKFLADSGFCSMRRVVRSPERWLKIVKVAQEQGYLLPNEPDAQALEKFLSFKRKEDPIRFPDLSLLIVKLMGSGEYIVEKPTDHPVGHFGLAVGDYMHSTAPNRRYPDLITLRLIKAVLAGDKSPYSMQELNNLAVHCTMQEDAAKKVERHLRKSEAALLLKSKIGKKFDGIVSGINDKGVWVRIFDPPVEGRLMVESSDTLLVGQLVSVKLTFTHVARGFIDFVLV